MLPDCERTEVREFRGPWPRLDPYSVPISNALTAQNVQYVKGQVGTRYGHSIVLSPNDAITSFFNWLFNVFGTPKNWFVYYAVGTGIRIIDLNSIAAPITWIAQATAYGVSFASAGNRFYAAFYSSNGAGNSAGQVSSYLGGTSTLFSAPISAAPTFNSPGAGVVTTGNHRFGYLIQTGNGFTTRPSPANAGGFVPFTFPGDGVHNMQMVVTTTWPTYASQIQVIMTTAANLNRYYAVPGAVASVTPGGLSTATITFNISDADLAATGLDVTNYLDLLTTDTSGNAPFFPYFLYTYSSRMAYVTLDPSGIPVTYFSESDNYQYITADQHGVYLPGNLPQTCGTSLRGVAYMFGPHWTYAVSDTGDVPVRWANPQLVDGSIGTLAPRGVFTNTAQGFIWVADVGGLYLFRGGQYPQRPISYYQQPDWLTINWAAANALVVVDDATNRRVLVYAPTGIATNPTILFVWDYADGTEPEQVKYSRDVIAGWSIGTAGTIQNPTSKKNEAWITNVGLDRVLRKNDGTETFPYRDVQNGGSPVLIQANHQTALLPGLDGPHGLLNMHHGDHLRLTGSGTLAIVVSNLDGTLSTSVINFAISNTPGLLYLIKYYLQSEHVTLTISSSAVDSNFILSYLAHYWTPGAPQR